MQQHGHPSDLRAFPRLPEATTRCASRLGAVVAAALLACAGTIAADTARAAPASRPSALCADANLHPSAANAHAVAAATLCLVNRVRSVHGLGPVRANRALSRVAASQVASMVHEDYFADVSPSGQTPLSLVAGTSYAVHAAEFAVGENIAWATGSYTTPAHIVAEWMASPPHREVMLSAEFRDAGVAVTPAVPAVLHAPGRGATYAIELGVRRF
jgi:uncharacterized protein YkwD